MNSIGQQWNTIPGIHDWLVAELQDYQLTPDDELPLYSADSRCRHVLGRDGKEEDIFFLIGFAFHI